MATTKSNKPTNKKSSPLDSDSIDAVLKYMSSLVTMKDITLAPTEKGFILFGSEGGSQVRVEMGSDSVSLKEPIKVPLLVFQKAIAGRKNIKLKVQNSLLHITASGYSAQLSTSESAEDLSIKPSDEEAKEIKFSATAWNYLATACQAIQIETLPGMDLNFFTKVSKKSVMAAVYDTTQMAFQVGPSEELECDPFELALPYDRISRILRGLPYDNTRLMITPGGVYVLMKKLRAFLPSVAVEASVSSEELREKAQEIMNLKGSKVSISLEALKGFLNSASSVSTGTAAAVTFTKYEDKVLAKAESSSGIIKERLEGICKKPFGIDLRFLQTMTSKVKGNLDITVTDAVAVTKSTNDSNSLYYVTALQGDDSSDTENDSGEEE
jgi:hypothetical protein